MRYLLLVLIIPISSFLYALKADNATKVKKEINNQKNKIEVKKIKDNFDFIENDDYKRKNKNRNPEIQKLIDELKNEFHQEIEILNKNYQNEKKILKDKFKLERDKIIKQFRKNKKNKRIKKF